MLELLEHELRRWNPAHNQITAFNHFITFELKRIIELNTPHSITLSNVRVKKPQYNGAPLYPADARRLGLTYEVDVCVDVAHYKDIVICSIPIMVNSIACNQMTAEECPYDVGGYFIINGTQRILMIQERMVYNEVYVYSGDTATIRSMSTETCHSVQVDVTIDKHKRIMAHVPPMDSIPVYELLQHIGMNQTYWNYLRHMVRRLFGDKAGMAELILNINMDTNEVQIDDATDDVCSDADSIESLHSILSEDNLPTDDVDDPESDGDETDAETAKLLQFNTFPHLTIECSKHKVLMEWISILIKLLACHVGVIPYDDRDHVANKRYEHAGMLISYLFTSLYKRLMSSTMKKLKENMNIVTILTQNESITRNLRNCFATGNWGIQRGYTRSGVCQNWNRISFMGTLSMYDRVMFPMRKDSKNKNTDIRQIHTSSYGFIDPTDTPEGQSVGIVKHLSLMVRISLGCSPVLIKNVLAQTMTPNYELYELQCTQFPTEEFVYRIFLNGEWVGSCVDATEFCNHVRRLRSEHRIPYDVSIYFNPYIGSIHMWCDEGRLLRPLVDLATRSICYLDANEINCDERILIALSIKDVGRGDAEYTHCEIHPSMILGMSSSIIPFAEHNQGPRNTYQCSMIKQAIGVPNLNYDLRFDTQTYLMHNTQRPIMTTAIDRIMNTADLGYGLNAIVAIGTFTGWNQEDSIIINRSAVDRGLFVCSSFRTFTSIELRTSNSSEYIEIPPPDIRSPGHRFEHCDERGIVRVGSRLGVNDVIVSRTLYRNGRAVSDCSLVMGVKDCMSGTPVVHKVFTDVVRGFRIVRVLVRVLKIPEVGDKFSSRIAQKGVCSILYSQEDMPFTADGIVPDLLINSLCIPSRMTIGQLLECVMGKAMCFEHDDYHADCTAFEHSGNSIMDHVEKVLVKRGFQREGEEIMYNGFTGEPFKSRIFIGPTYYQRLKHMVSDKYHARSHGDKQRLTRQPVEGRSRDGGLRFGEMEKDSMIGYGAASFVRERLRDASDPFEIFVCQYCNQFSDSTTICHRCHTRSVQAVRTSYVFKLLMHELMALGLKVDIEASTV